MQKFLLNNQSYRALLDAFTNWLDVLGFSTSTIKNYPHQLCEFFYWLEQQELLHIKNVQKEHITAYYRYLKERPNQTQSGGLSNAYLNSHVNTLKKFNVFLKKHQAKPLPLHLKREATQEQRIKYCSQEEIKLLFKSASSYPLPKFRARHTALLVCLYSLGMRRNEIVNLQLNDILWDKERVFVRKGKNYKERFVPINQYNLSLLEDYVFEGRLNFKEASTSDYVFITQYNPKMCGAALETSLKQIVKNTHDEHLQDKRITPHTLRHSIATHFLQAGMAIEDIQQFLGHASLESTQVYTHILNQPHA